MTLGAQIGPTWPQFGRPLIAAAEEAVVCALIWREMDKNQFLTRAVLPKENWEDAAVLFCSNGQRLALALAEALWWSVVESLAKIGSWGLFFGRKLHDICGSICKVGRKTIVFFARGFVCSRKRFGQSVGRSSMELDLAREIICTPMEAT